MRGEWNPKMSQANADCLISLTSWRPRLSQLPLALLTLLQQSVRPKGIVVWLTDEDHRALSARVRDRFGEFDVRFAVCDDLGSHKKWLPMIEEGHGDRFVICDDDIIYPPEWFGALIAEDRTDAYAGCKCHRIICDADGSVAPYSQWKKQITGDGNSSHRIFITGCGGAMIHPNRIEKPFLERAAIFAKCPRNDDIWLKAAHVAADIPCFKTKYCFPCLEFPESYASGLAASNVDAGGNDEQIRKVGNFFCRICAT
jgi:hypothetical protein